MKFCIISILLCVVLSNAEYALEKRSAHYRLVRYIMSDANQNRFLDISSIIDNCRRNGMTAETLNKLKETFDDVELCAGKKQIYFVPEAEFIQNINDCSKELVRLSKACLKESQGYYPDLLVAAQNSVTHFMYANKDVVSSNEVQQCYRKVLKNNIARDKYRQCIGKASEGVDKVEIPHSKAEACRVLIKISKCLPQMFTDQCDASSNLDKFLKAYDEVIAGPCSA
ncbi:uncharacterized protein LOC126885075 [Diabrotica virgifera virgifera]|uniref:Uncharacterized protein LOC114349230 n=1 Tax=Diabrotica virgifera virgifera TaxID=50390 RepID=A0A6P7H1J2_DIAVI|nr:uncharacterized protein LOC126885075 [Diabrotica virgifera virgifera]